MRKPTVDYRNLNFKTLFSQHSHLLLLLGWVFYFTFYFLTENLIPYESCYVIHSPLDDLIPFCEVFIVPYFLWYFLIIFAIIYFALYNLDNFKGLLIFIYTTQIIAMAIYVIFPNRQDLRPDVFPRDNIFTDVLGSIYAIDTSTNVCPSLHVAYSVGIASAFLKEKSASKFLRIFVTVFCFFVCISVVFVKQHSVIDIFAAIPLCILAEIIAYRKYWKSKFRKDKP